MSHSAGQTAGTVCIAPIPMDGSWKGNATGATLASTFTIQVDDLPAVKVTTNLSGAFTNLAFGQKHMVKFRLDGKPRESFPLKFETFERRAGDRVVHIRLRYDTMYGYWQPERVDALPCKCQKSLGSAYIAWHDFGRSTGKKETIIVLTNPHNALPDLFEYRLQIQTDENYTTLSFSLPKRQRGIPSEKIVRWRNDF